ncbi:MAG: SynChlorMet cassette radical SAM/SPASM protein ScmE [Candidatus Saganbacteria bacterium]|nr:SynChlorMet cassette radical SAM/SPASM protein ScmE [Candidatus Saganbacteria bacterium]
MKTPKSVDLATTNNCNLRCKYCSHFSSPGEVAGDLPTEEWLQFIEELGRCSVMNLTLEGGETFVRKDLKKIIDAIVKNGMRFSILSNGTLITEEWAEFLASTGRCSSVQVSIDGSIPVTHDSCRGEGTFHKALQGLANLRKYKLSATVRMTIHRKNVRDIEGVARLLIDELGLSGFSTNSASHMGTCKQNAEQVQLTVEERGLAMESLLLVNKKYGGRVGAMAGPLAEAKHWTKMVQAEREGAKPFSGGGYLTSCGGPMNKIAIRADGVMVPCLQLCTIELGRINKDSLADVWQNHPELWRFRERREIPLTNFEFCKDCKFIPYCRGNCPALADTFLGDPYHPSPDACLKRFLEAGGKLPDEKLLMEKEACACV